MNAKQEIGRRKVDSDGTWYDSDAVQRIIAREQQKYDALLAACKNLENDDGSIPAHAWELVQDAIALTEGVTT